MMECKHVMANFTMRDEPNVIRGCYAVWLGPINESAKKYRADFGYSPGRVLSAKCPSCGAQLGLGQATGTPFDGPSMGSCLLLEATAVVVDLEDRESRDADAWPWDPSRPIAGQYEEHVARLAVRDVCTGIGRLGIDGQHDDEDASEPRTPGCRCHLEVGDSPCPVHPSPDVGETLTIANVTITLDPPGPDLSQLTPAESAELVRILADVPSEACVCGHAKEDHGGHVDYPGSSACNECEPDACIAYEVAP